MLARSIWLPFGVLGYIQPERLLIGHSRSDDGLEESHVGGSVKRETDKEWIEGVNVQKL